MQYGYSCSASKNTGSGIARCGERVHQHTTLRIQYFQKTIFMLNKVNFYEFSLFCGTVAECHISTIIVAYKYIDASSLITPKHSTLSKKFYSNYLD